MNSRSRTTGTSKTSARKKKPATIDLQAKEVTSTSESRSKPAKTTEGKSTSEKTMASGATETVASASSGLGRAAKESASTKKSQSEKASATDMPQAGTGKPDGGPKVEAQSKQVQYGLFPGLIGAAIAIAGLGLIGQFDAAKNLPIIGSLYAEAPAPNETSVDEEKIAELQIQLDELKSRDTASTAVSEDITARLDEMETSLASLQDSLNSFVASADSGNGAINPQFSSTIAVVNDRIEDLESRIAGLSVSDTTGESGSNEQLIELREEMDAQFSAIETGITEIRGAVAANSNKLQSMDNQASALENTIASIRASEKVAMSVAVKALGEALRNDISILPALSTIGSLAGITPELRQLNALAEEGIPSRKQLLASLAEFTYAIQNPPSDVSSGSISDRLWANAQNLVTFRSSGPQEGDYPAAILSRVKAHLETGDLTSARNEWQSLPYDIRLRGSEWLEMLDRRINAFALQDKLSTQLSLNAG